MSDSHTNPSGLPKAGRRTGTETPPGGTGELSVIRKPDDQAADVPDGAGPARPAGPGPQRTAEPGSSGAFRRAPSSPRELGPTTGAVWRMALAQRPAEQAERAGQDEQSQETAIALPDTDAARQASAVEETPSPAFPPPLELPPGVQRPALTAPGRPAEQPEPTELATFAVPDWLTEAAASTTPSAPAEPPAPAEPTSSAGSTRLNEDDLWSRPATSEGSARRPRSAVVAPPTSSTETTDSTAPSGAATPAGTAAPTDTVTPSDSASLTTPATSTASTSTAAHGVPVETADRAARTSTPASGNRAPAPNAAGEKQPEPQGPLTGQFTSRRERKLYETGAIGLPTAKATGPAAKQAKTGATSADPATSTGQAAVTRASATQGSAAQAAAAQAPATHASATQATQAPEATSETPVTGSSSAVPTATEPQSRRAKRPAETTNPPKRRIGALVARVLAALIALAGIVLLVVGGLKATVWAPSDVVVGTLSGSSQKFVTAEIGALALAGPRLQVEVSGAGSDPVFIGIGRASDVDAYLGEAATDRIAGLDLDEGTLVTKASGSDTAEVLDPASADVWSVSALGQGSAKLTWPDPASGQWRLVIATDGTRAAPQNVTLTWSGDEPENTAPAWITVGVVLLVAGVIVSMLLRARARDRKES